MVDNYPEEPLQPPWPKPKPYTSNIFRRLARGWKSWFGLLNEWDFRVSLGELNLLGKRVFLVNDPLLVRKVLVDEVDLFPKHPYTLWILEPLIGRAIFSVNGEEWAIQRRLIDQAFQVANLKKAFPAMTAATSSLLHRLEMNGVDSFVDIDKEMTMVAADVIIRTILSRPIEGDEATDIFKAFSRYQRHAGRALVLRFLRLPKSLIQLSLKDDAKVIRNWIQAFIHERLEQNKVDERNPLEKIDFLDTLIMAEDPKTKKKFSEQDLVDQVCFLFLAGHETSASSLGIAAWLLARSPEVQKQMRVEVMSVVCDRPIHSMLRFDELRQLPYSEAVFNEALRLYPPVSFFIRDRDKKDGELATSEGRRRCPVGSLLTLSPWVIQRHDKYWPEPHQFKPERFLKNSSSLQRNAFLPFGMGPRKCPGASFAKQEALLVLAELVRRYELLPVTDQDPDFVGLLTVRSQNGIRLRLRELEHKT
ncbi:cytochrome P450 [Prochlorococcus sp. MIT 1307]|uniref:cytochrome P450 n=1 Tax=Prochlorococcus sp. MIT 1307 TaxID=3096219 RepID=UPI002A761CF1|nr:cytochrome P450 [Prochlorococcus sp. MIT 1307]